MTRSAGRAIRRVPAAGAAALFLLLAIAGCTVHVAPVVATDPQNACPGGSPEWRLVIVDQRADRASAADVAAPIRESILRSLPGCRWAASGAPAPVITIEVHRFTVAFDDVWEAAVEWSVVARDRGGRTLTEFQAETRVTRPNYRGADNEKAALQEAMNEAMQRTLTGLRAIPVGSVSSVR